MNQPLKNFCTCMAKADSSDEFVGTRYENGSIKIHFPLGYFQNDDAIQNMHDDELRAHISGLFAVLADDSLAEENQNSSLSNFLQDESEVRFPMRAYLNVLRNYVDFGYYVEREVEYKRGAHGKINWDRTIKTTRPVVTEDEQNVVYLDPIARHVDYNENELIALVHKYCVHDASKKLGFIFGIEIQEEPSLDFDYELFSSVLQSKISKTFNDRNLNLFLDLQRIVEYLGDKNSKDNANANDFYFGVNKFAPVWEAMIDRIFGTVSNKNLYNPHLKYVAENVSEENLESDGDTGESLRSTLRPDTIMRRDTSVYVLDSKYYRFGLTKNPSHLPGAESICKQMAYAEYVEKTQNPEYVYNAFVMPYCCTETSKSPYGMKRVCFIYGDWKDIGNASKLYHKIACILLDMKSVMRNYTSNGPAQEKLATIITKN